MEFYIFRNGYELNLKDLDERLEISEDGKRLTITDSDISDTARYTCIAANIAGEAEKSFDLDVQGTIILLIIDLNR